MSLTRLKVLNISVKDMATSYEARVKQEFNEGLKALENNIGDIKTLFTIYRLVGNF
ncbi:hypothetical protein KDE13_07490 [Campylobacter sp. faydin G-140]|uniref:hypothetical protein n=1 Tax=Campylobacter anatolicus TaxID=2829105 RepID=UPI001B9D63F1|nr:hypothetical protein [Campylobacter anatolicus]MBR8466180.1 hypothetical protein [Campylobacter anatolicus]